MPGPAIIIVSWAILLGLLHWFTPLSGSLCVILIWGSGDSWHPDVWFWPCSCLVSSFLLAQSLRGLSLSTVSNTSHLGNSNISELVFSKEREDNTALSCLLIFRSVWSVNELRITSHVIFPKFTFPFNHKRALPQLSADRTLCILTGFMFLRTTCPSQTHSLGVLYHKNSFTRELCFTLVARDLSLHWEKSPQGSDCW